MIGKNKSLVLLLTAMMLLALFSSLSLAILPPAEVWVCADTGNDANDGSEASPFATIQKGVDEAQEGATVKVKAGDYTESITIGKALTLQGQPGAAIDAGVSAHGISVEAAGVTLKDITVKGANYTVSVKFNEFSGSAPYAFVMQNCLLDGLSSSWYGIFFSGTISGGDILLEGNTITGVDYGIYFDSTSIAGSEILLRENTVTSIYQTLSLYDLETVNLTIQDNSLTSTGDYAIYFSGEISAISTVTIGGNDITSVSREAIRFNDYINDSVIIIDDNEITAEYEGIEFYDMYDSTISVINNTITAGNEGIEFCCNYRSNINIEGNTITADDEGIDLGDNYGSTVSVLGNTVTSESYYGINFYDLHEGSTLWAEDNTVVGDRHGMYFCCIDGQSSITVINNTIHSERNGMYFSNRIREESTVVLSGNTITSKEEGIYFNPQIENSTLTIESNTINADEGGTYFPSRVENSTVAIDSNTVNSAGTGIHFNHYIQNGSEVNINDNTIVSAEADGIYVYSLNYSTMELTGNQIEDCNIGAYFDYISDGSGDPTVLRITRNTFKDNSTALYFNSISLEDDASEIYICSVFTGNGTDLDNDSCYDLTVLHCPTYTVTFSVTSGSGSLSATAKGTAVTSGDSLISGSKVVFTAVPNSGSKIRNWIIDDVPVSSTASTYTIADLQADVEIRVEFMSIPFDDDSPPPPAPRFTLTMAVEGEGTVSPGIGEHRYNKDTAVSLQAVPAEGWIFSKWLGPVGDTAASSSTITMSQNLSVTAVFLKKQEQEPAPAKVIVLSIGSKKTLVNDKESTMDVEPYLDRKSNRTMVPVRFISEYLGAAVQWLPNTKQVKIVLGETEIILTSGSATALVNGKEVPIDSPPEIHKERTFVPLRFVSEMLNAAVQWDSETKDITIKR